MAGRSSAAQSAFNCPDALIHRYQLTGGNFIPRESSYVLQRDKKFAPAIRKSRRQRVSRKNCTQRAQIPAVAPSLNKRLQRFKQGFRGVTAGAGNLTFPFC
jgi:hypothetical protein